MANKQNKAKPKEGKEVNEGKGKRGQRKKKAKPKEGKEVKTTPAEEFLKDAGFEGEVGKMTFTLERKN